MTKAWLFKVSMGASGCANKTIQVIAPDKAPSNLPELARLAFCDDLDVDPLDNDLPSYTSPMEFELRQVEALGEVWLDGRVA